MVWVRLDDEFPAHPKVSQLTDREFRVHIRTLCWSAKYRTYGNLPSGVFNDVAGLTRALGRKFLAVGLWDETDEPGMYVIHDALKYLKRDETNALRQAEWRKRHRKSNGESNGGSNALQVTPDVTEEVTVPYADAHVRAPVPVPALPSEEISTAKAVSSGKKAAERSAMKRIMAYVNSELGHKWTLNSVRETKIRGRFREGYTEEQLLRVVDGVLLDPWEGRTLSGNDDPKVIFRDGSQVDKFLGFVDNPATRNGHAETDAERKDRIRAEMLETQRRADARLAS